FMIFCKCCEMCSILFQGETFKLSCSYSTNNDYVVLYWYRQNPKGKPQYLLRKGARLHHDDNTSDGRFQSTTSRASTELTITDVLTDSALYYCALKPTMTGNSTTVYKNILNKKTRKPFECFCFRNIFQRTLQVKLSCSYSTTSNNVLII
uniref:Ig-like domain-containing protein n=1 Tax=Cyprinus carpio TaxID=7962 RepID=A0A8C1RZP9_CYPCA